MAFIFAESANDCLPYRAHLQIPDAVAVLPTQHHLQVVPHSNTRCGSHHLCGSARSGLSSLTSPVLTPLEFCYRHSRHIMRLFCL